MSKLLKGLIASLSAEEGRAADHWLACPEHNTREDLRKLFTYYQKSGSEEKEEEAWQAVMPGTPLDLKQLRLLRSYLLRCLEEWLAYRKWRNDNANLPGGASLTQAYRQRGLAYHLRNRLLRRRNLLTRRPAGHPADLLLRYEMEKDYFTMVAAEKRLESHNLADLQSSLDTLIIARKLRAACQVLSSGRLTGQKADIFLLTECLNRAEASDLAGHPAIQPYYLACKLLLDGGENDFQRYYQHLLQQTAGLEDERKDLLYIAINHCVRQINRGALDYLKRAFALYRLGIKQKLLYDHGRISSFTFSNIVGIGLRLDETDWIADFIGTHRHRLSGESGEEVYALNAARLAYHRNNFEEALVYLRQADFKDMIHHLSARTLQLKIYWELDYQHLIGSHLKNTRAWLNRKKKSSYHLNNYRNIFTLANRIYRLGVRETEEVDKIRKAIIQTEPLTERAWLLKCLE